MAAEVAEHGGQITSGTRPNRGGSIWTLLRQLAANADGFLCQGEGLLAPPSR